MFYIFPILFDRLPRYTEPSAIFKTANIMNGLVTQWPTFFPGNVYYVLPRIAPFACFDFGIDQREREFRIRNKNEDNKRLFFPLNDDISRIETRIEIIKKAFSKIQCPRF